MDQVAARILPWRSSGTSSTRAGFTLIELAFVLVIIGLLLGMGSEILPMLIKQNKVRENRVLVREVKTSILGYALATGRLPFAASSENGTETSGRLQGYLPYATIGVRGKDVSLRTLFYAVEPALTGTTNREEFQIRLRELITGVRTPDLFCDNGTFQAAFVVLSSGENLQVDPPNDDNGNGRVDIHDDNQFSAPSGTYTSDNDDILDAVSITYLHGILKE
ncbi:MAG TPA: prepilin-type N-terminal cleavage/methylation domain-containing protein [Deltaproteobacteria bacterium]|nr:prepilin-type N-terminal cleavage/methylation domain-containing protein [Deltaproteobacteria bacterium]